MLALGLGDVTESEARNAWKDFNIWYAFSGQFVRALAPGIS